MADWRRPLSRLALAQCHIDAAESTIKLWPKISRGLSASGLSRSHFLRFERASGGSSPSDPLFRDSVIASACSSLAVTSPCRMPGSNSRQPVSRKKRPAHAPAFFRIGEILTGSFQEHAARAVRRLVAA